MYPQDEEFHQRHIAEYVKQNIRELAGMPPSLYNRAARFFYFIVPQPIFNWSMRCAPPVLTSSPAEFGIRRMQGHLILSTAPVLCCKLAPLDLFQ